jgi:hypothetical protein
VTKKRINMGFETYPELSLANARKKAVEARELLAQGINPKVHRNTINEAKRRNRTYLREHRPRLVRTQKNGKHSA